MSFITTAAAADSHKIIHAHKHILAKEREAMRPYKTLYMATALTNTVTSIQTHRRSSHRKFCTHEFNTHTHKSCIPIARITFAKKNKSLNVCEHITRVKSARVATGEKNMKYFSMQRRDAVKLP